MKKSLYYKWLLAMAGAVCALLPGLAHAESALFVGAGGQLWGRPDLDGNGIALVHYRTDGPAGGTLQLEWNTDTLTVGWLGLPLGDGLSLSLFGRAEALIAGVLIHYHQDGQKIPERGFFASYGELGATLGMDRAPHFVQVEVGGRRWAFTESGPTGEGVTLPADTWTLQTRARYTFWRFAHDDAFAQPHRTTWRLDGLGAGLELGADLRTDARPFGDLEGRYGSPEARNDAERAPTWLRAWAGFGRRLGPSRLQVVERVGAGRNQDDVSRARVGGNNPYVVPVLGLPWATWMPDAYAATRLSLHLPILRDAELGPALDVLFIPRADARRLAAPDDLDGLALVAGAGLLADLRLGPWQLDAQLGWAVPSHWLEGGPHVSGFVWVGRQVW